MQHRRGLEIGFNNSRNRLDLYSSIYLGSQQWIEGSDARILPASRRSLSYQGSSPTGDLPQVHLYLGTLRLPSAR